MHTPCIGDACIDLVLDMSILSRVVSNHAASLKSTGGLKLAFRPVRSLQSTATDSTADTMDLDSESQQEDPGYEIAMSTFSTERAFGLDRDSTPW